MTTREVYYKLYVKSELPVAIAYFASKDKNDVIQLGQCIFINFNDTHEENIKKMEKIADRKGFMFWMISTEGQNFIEENKGVLAKVLANTILGTRPDDEEAKF